jgi:hypothetical protein
MVVAIDLNRLRWLLIEFYAKNSTARMVITCSGNTQRQLAPARPRRNAANVGRWASLIRDVRCLLAVAHG